MIPSAVTAGDFLFLSGIRGEDSKTGACSGDTRRQAAAAFENIAAELSARGLSLRHVVKVTMFLGDLDYRDLIHEVWLQYFPDDPPARTSFQIADANATPGGGAHFVLDVVALARPEAASERETLERPHGGPRRRGMVTAVKARGFIFFSAIRGRNPLTKTYSEDTREQARQAFENIKAILEHHGSTLRHVVKVTMYLNDLAYRNPIHEVWKEYFPEDPPARTALRVVNASASARWHPHFVLDVIALAA
jgi:2-iminobutanoate/2-iminopropanoate deaminase